jgi:hypothetical protein
LTEPRRAAGPAALAVLAAAAAILGACATRPIRVGEAVSGDATAAMLRDGSIHLTVRTPGAAPAVVVFRPGDPAYDALKAEVEAAWPAKRKPTLTWEVGKPVYGP